MSLQDDIRAYAEAARLSLLDRVKVSEDKGQEGVAFWMGFNSDGNGIVKQNGVLKVVKVIGNASISLGSKVYVDKQNTIEVGNVRKSNPPLQESKKKATHQQELVKSRPLILQDERDFVICIAVIDENDGMEVNTKWSLFRSTYPDRPFYLLRPVPQSTPLTIPSVKWGPSYLAYYHEVCRSTCTSDWFNLAELNGANKGANVILFVDTSGSMDLDTVLLSYNLFKGNAISANLKVKNVFNGSEDYIEPFFVPDTFFNDYTSNWPA